MRPLQRLNPEGNYYRNNDRKNDSYDCEDSRKVH